MINKTQNQKTDSEQFLIDSGILVSAFSQKENKEKRAISIKVIESGIDKICITQQNLVEFANIMLYSLRSQDSKEILRIISNLQSVFKILQYSKEEISQALELTIGYKVDFNDALLAQTMLDNNIHLIYTENTKDFNKIPGIKAINPFTDKKIARLCEKARKQQQKYQKKQRK